MTDVSYMVFVLHLIIALNWGLQSKYCQNDSRPRITLSIKMQARRGLQGREACSHGWVTHAEVVCSNPNRQQRAGATAFWFCLSGFADQQKAMEIPSPHKAVALKQLLFFTTAIRKLWTEMTVTHFKPEMTSDVSGGLYLLTQGCAHGDPRYILLWKKSCGPLPNAVWIRMHQVWLPLPKAALHHSQQPLCPPTHALTAYRQACDICLWAFCKNIT